MVAHCNTCMYRENKIGYYPCCDCFAFSNYRPVPDIFDTVKSELGITSPSKLYFKEDHMSTQKSKVNILSPLEPIEPAYVTYMGRTFKTHDISLHFGLCDEYETLSFEVAASPSNLVESFGPTPKIKDIIFNPPATIVFWDDNTKTVVRAQGDDIYDPEKGIAMAISKKILGNNYDYYHTFAKYLKKYDKQQKETHA